jgi:alpha-L-fucosidase
MFLLMKKISALFLVLVMLFSASSLAETVVLKDYGFFITLPDGWAYEEQELTEEYTEAGVVYSIHANAGDESAVMWLDIYSFEKEHTPAAEMVAEEFEGYVSDMREYYPDMSYFSVNDVPFLYYTAAGDDGEFLTAYTWTASHEFSFTFRAEKLTDEVRSVIDQIMDSYKTL